MMVSVPLSVDTLARTIWGEARGCGVAGMQNVACVIMNRVNHPSWWGNSVVSVCIQPYQFSCRNATDPNLAKLTEVTTSDIEFSVALNIAESAVAGQLPDYTDGADSYYALSMPVPPPWAIKATKTYTDGWHVFCRTVLSAPPGSHPDVPNIGVTSSAVA